MSDTNALTPAIILPQPPLPDNPLVGTSTAGTGVLGESNFGAGIYGRSVGTYDPHRSPPGQPGTDGVRGDGVTGVHGIGWDGVFGEGQNNGVHGKSSSRIASGVWGENTGGAYGVSGSTNSNYQPGPNGTAGVWGNNVGSGNGVKGTSSGGDAVLGYSSSNAHAGVAAVNDSGGFGVWARGTPAGHFEGTVEVTGDLNCAGNINLSTGNINLSSSTGDIILANQDCAEDFEMAGAGQIDPGSVVVIDSEGAFKQSDRAYDKRVAGVVSGAGDCKPGIVLGRHQLQENKRPVALVGKVFCKVDAGYSPIEVGDLLTTSPTTGHAMKVGDHVRAFGAVIGKALRSLEAGQGLIPILVALQ